MDKKVLLAFAEAIQQKKIIQLTFTTKDNQCLIRKCVPLDLAPSMRAKIKYYKYHVWNLDSLPKPHILSLNPEQVIQMEVTAEHFRPEEIVTWTRKQDWTIARDWGSLS